MISKRNRSFPLALFAAWVAIVNLLTCTVASAAEKENFEEFLASLFPGASFENIHPYFGKDTSARILGNIKLRGKKGFIPSREVKCTKVSNTLTVAAFPIYLHESDMPQTPLVKQSPPTDHSHTKLVQVLFFNPTDQTLFGKPDGFPLESTGWTCSGDFCDNIAVIGVETINNSSTAVVFKYNYGVSSHKLKVLALDGSSILSSPTYNYGDLGGESGIEASIEYINFSQANNIISATTNSFCDTNEIDFCVSRGLSGGITRQVVPILELSTK